MEAEKITKLFQAIGAALALPVAAAGVYTVYRTNFSPDTACQNLRASIVSIMEKNVGLDAKKALLKKDIEDFDKNCGDTDPAARAMFQAVLEGKASVGELSARAQTPAARPAAAAAAAPTSPPQPVQSASPPAGTAPVVATPAAAPPPVVSAPVVPTPQHMPPQTMPPPSSYASPVQMPQPVQSPPVPAQQPASPPAQQARPVQPMTPARSVQPAAQGQAQQVSGQAKVAAKQAGAPAETRGWVVLARREGIRRAEIYFDGFQFSLTSFPPPGTVLTARVAVPILADINPRPGAGTPPASQGTVKQGACVKVLSTRAGIGRLWADVVSVRC